MFTIKKKDAFSIIDASEADTLVILGKPVKQPFLR